MNELHQIVLVTRNMVIERTISWLSGGEGAWRSLQPTQGDAAMQRWQKRDQGGPGLYGHEARLLEKCHRISCTALGAVAAFVVDFADFVVSLAHRMRMTCCRFMRMNRRRMGHFV